MNIQTSIKKSVMSKMKECRKMPCFEGTSPIGAPRLYLCPAAIGVGERRRGSSKRSEAQRSRRYFLCDLIACTIVSVLRFVPNNDTSTSHPPKRGNLIHELIVERLFFEWSLGVFFTQAHFKNWVFRRNLSSSESAYTWKTSFVYVL